MKNDLAERLRSNIERRNLFPRPGVAMLAVSGGPDSVALLDLMARVSGNFGLELIVAHVDHGISPDSGDVAEMVMGLAVRYGFPGVMASLNLEDAHNLSETKAREWRYDALRRLKRRHEARYLVTAHHADDQIETVLFRVLRGSAPAGLAGIPEVGPDGLVRPLLAFKRSQLEDWLRLSERRLPVHQDPANADFRHDRSWIRGHLLPEIRARFTDRTDDNLLCLAEFAGVDRDAWQSVIDELPGLDARDIPGGVDLDLGRLVRYDKSLAQAILRGVAQRSGFVLGPRKAGRLFEFAKSAQSGRRMELGHGWVGEIAFGRLRFHILRGEPKDPVVWGGTVEGQTTWGSWEISWRKEKAEKVTRSGWTTWVGSKDGQVRSFEPGDSMEPYLGRGTRPVKRLLMEGRVPLSERPSYPLVTSLEGILWVPGLCRSDLAVPALGAEATRLEVRKRGDGGSKAGEGNL